MFELYYRSPEDTERETSILSEVVAGGGHLDFREEMNSGVTICLTYEFPEWGQAVVVMDKLRKIGEHIEEAHWYGD